LARWNFIQLYIQTTVSLWCHSKRQNDGKEFLFKFSMWWETKNKNKKRISVCFVLFLGTFTRFSFHLWISFEKTSKRVNFRLLLLISTRKKTKNIFYVIRLHSEQIALNHNT
jgi:hypothetical protein